MKKFIKIFISLALISLLFACANDNITHYDYKIGMIPDTGGVNDQSFNQISWEGLKKFGEDHKNVKVGYMESKVDSDFYVNAQIFIDSGYDLIITVGYNFKDCTEKLAKENPDVNFLLIDETIENMDNVSSAIFNMEEASYLAGVIAANVSKTNCLGYIAGNNSNLLNAFGVGFIEGAKSVKNDIVVLQNNINSFSDATLAKVVANSMIVQSADVIYTAAGPAAPGTISACAENNALAIGVDTDQSFVDPEHVLTSAVKRIDNAIYDLCEDFINGKPISGIRRFNLENKGVGVVKNNKFISKELLEQVEKVEKDIIDKKIIVHSKAKDCPDFELDK